MREGKAFAAKREQLEHAALKVKSDVGEMRAKYQETVSTINALISDPNLLLTSSRDALGDAGQHSEPSRQDLDLSLSSVVQLKKLNQLSSAQVEKMDKKLKEKLSELDRTKEELQQRIRYILQALAI